MPGSNPRCCYAAGMCAVFLKESHMLEVYKWWQCANNNGAMELVHTFEKVRRLPDWRDAWVQVQHTS